MIGHAIQIIYFKQSFTIMTTYFYCDIEDSFQQYRDRLEQYAIQHKQNIYMLRMPKNDVNDYDEYNCFMLLSPTYKVTLVNVSENAEDFHDYCDDVEDAVSYLYTKYEYKKELGRFRTFFSELKEEVEDIVSLDNLDKFFQGISLRDSALKRYSTIVVSLCTGSINDINRVKAGVPQTLLQKVKQKIQLFDADQTRFIYQNLDKKRIRIQGLSGTGKTELLLHKLKELYTKDSNLRIFVTCHNKILADALSSKIPKFFNFMKVSQQIEWNERLWCTNAWGRYGDENSGFYRYLCQFYDLVYYRYNKFTSFDSVCRNAVNEIKQLKSKGDFKFAFDYMLVDECQDFPESFFELCELVVKKQVYMAGDIFQSIFEEHKISDYTADYFLTKCYRTDPKTLMFAHAMGLGLFEHNKLRWLKQVDWEACGYTYADQGNFIELSREPVVRFQDIDNQYKSVEITPFEIEQVGKSVCGIIKKIQEDNEDVTVNDICVILLDDEEYIYSWADLIESWISVEFKWEANKAYISKHTIRDTLLISNRNNVKGLEYPFVICVTKGFVANVQYRNSLYTMLTRSFLKSYLLISNRELKNIEVLSQNYDAINKTHKLILKKPSEDELAKIETSFKRMSNNRPLADEIRDMLKAKGIPAKQVEMLVKMALDLGWQNLSLEELEENVTKLVSLSNF